MENFKLFKKIFDLDPNEVQEFVKAQAENYYRDYSSKLPKDAYTICVEWAPWCNELYAYVSPNLKTEDWKHYFLQDKEVDLAKYFEIKGCHWHFTFPQIYGMMTGETVLDEEMEICDDETDEVRAWVFYYKKEWTEIVLNKAGKLYITDWDDKTDTEIRKPIPEDLMKVFNKEVKL